MTIPWKADERPAPIEERRDTGRMRWVVRITLCLLTLMAFALGQAGTPNAQPATLAGLLLGVVTAMNEWRGP